MDPGFYDFYYYEMAIYPPLPSFYSSYLAAIQNRYISVWENLGYLEGNWYKRGPYIIEVNETVSDLIFWII